MNSFVSFGILPIRIMAGITLIAHGLPKFYDITGGNNFFRSVGIPSKLFIPIALLEAIGGLAILFGILTRIASALIVIEMIGVIVMVKLSKGFVGGYEFELLLMSICITLVIFGPGKISIENYILKREIFPKGKQVYQKTFSSKADIK
jgi:putative oxidoreductase